MKIKELPTSERPYEKEEMYGVQGLSNSELLAIIIKAGTKEKTSIQLAQEVLSIKGTKDKNNDMRFLQDVSIEEFMQIKGIGKVKAIQLKAVCELAKRITKPMDLTRVQINNPQVVANLLIEELKFEKREKIKELILNSKNILIKILDISYGGTNSAIIDIKSILSEPIKMGAPKIILVHNHPSGDPTPSKEDIDTTIKVKEAAEMFGIELLDHIVMGDGKYKSIYTYVNNTRIH